MSIFSRLFQRDAQKAASPPVDANKAATAEGKSPRRISIRSSFMAHWLRGDYTLENSELIFSAVSRLANSLSAMPMMLYQESKPKKGELSDIVGFQPNPNMTACQFFRTFEACRCTSGNGYALKVPVPGRAVPYMYIIDPGRVQPIVEQETRDLWYRINPEYGAPYYIHNYHVLHVPFVSTNGYVGINPISVLLRTLNYSEEIEVFSQKQLQKGINAQIVLESPANLGEEQKKLMVESFLETYKETGGNILMLESGVTAKSLNISPVDTKLFEVERIARSRVAMVYNIPPHMLGDFTDTSFTSQEQQTLEYLSLTMLPIVTAYEQEFTRKLVPQKDRMRGYRLKMNIASILRGDLQTMADVHQKAIRGGWMTPNEARYDDNLPSDKDGGKLMVARDLTTLEYVINHPDNTAITQNKKEENVDGKHD